MDHSKQNENNDHNQEVNVKDKSEIWTEFWNKKNKKIKKEENNYIPLPILALFNLFRNK